jgi:hypothetical protein
MGVYKNILNFKKELQREAGIELDYFFTNNPIVFEYHSRTHFTLPYLLMRARGTRRFKWYN